MQPGGHVYPNESYKNMPVSANGITRRDWLAGLAMQGMLTNMKDYVPDDPAKSREDFQAIPFLAYVIADAMIAESTK